MSEPYRLTWRWYVALFDTLHLSNWLFVKNYLSSIYPVNQKSRRFVLPLLLLAGWDGFVDLVGPPKSKLAQSSLLWGFGSGCLKAVEGAPKSNENGLFDKLFTFSLPSYAACFLSWNPPRHWSLPFPLFSGQNLSYLQTPIWAYLDFPDYIKHLLHLISACLVLKDNSEIKGVVSVSEGDPDPEVASFRILESHSVASTAVHCLYNGFLIIGRHFGLPKKFSFFIDEGDLDQLIFLGDFDSSLPDHLFPVIQVVSLGGWKRRYFEDSNSLSLIAKN